MEQPHFYQRPAFRAVMLGLLLLAVYVYSMLRQGGTTYTLAGVGLDLLLALLLFQCWLFFYAQFVLPVRALRHRSEIGGRVLLHARGSHGPIIFVRNGRLSERPGESNKPGPGLLWVDTASAVVTRSRAGSKHALGPGMHFLDKRSEIAGTFSLHAQRFSIGPNWKERPFEKLLEGAVEQERRKHAELQAKRMSVSGRTRDGNEVIPRINVAFKLDARPAAPGMAGSRFGFSGEAVERAALGEGISLGSETEHPNEVAWNQLPGLIAVDLWREYLGKFTLDELFTDSFAPLPNILQPEEPVRRSELSKTPLILRQGYGARLLKQVNDAAEEWLESRGIREDSRTDGRPSQIPTARLQHSPAGRFTALQVIVQMIKARMMQAAVPILDDCGRVVGGHAASEEFKRLKERGLAVLDVGVDQLQFEPAVESQLVQQWNTDWMSNATGGRRQVGQLELLAAEAGRLRALTEYTGALAQAIQNEAPATTAETVATMVRATQGQILADERLLREASQEMESLVKLLKWAESDDAE